MSSPLSLMLTNHGQDPGEVTLPPTIRPLGPVLLMTGGIVRPQVTDKEKQKWKALIIILF